MSVFGWFGGDAAGEKEPLAAADAQTSADAPATQDNAPPSQQKDVKVTSWKDQIVNETDFGQLGYMDADDILIVDTEAGKDKGMMVFMEETGVVHRTKWNAAPFGMTFGMSQEIPLVVSKVFFESEAEKIGIVPGWTLKMIEGQRLKYLSYPEAMDCLKKMADSLPRTEPLTLEFQEYYKNQDIGKYVYGERQRHVFYKRPIGISVEKHKTVGVVDPQTREQLKESTVKVFHTEGAAKRNQVPEGWLLVKVNKEWVDGMVHASAFKLFQEAEAKLPRRAVDAFSSYGDLTEKEQRELGKAVE